MNRIFKILWVVTIVPVVIGVYFLSHRESAVIPDSNNDLSELLAEMASNIDVLSKEMSNLNSKINEIDSKLYQNNEILLLAKKEYSKTYKDKLPAEIDKPNVIISESDLEKYEVAKTTIYSALVDPSVTLMDITQSDELKSLPVEMQHEVMREIVRRFNSGELNKRHFIPGSEK